MHRYRGGYSASSSKASPTTRCQKCLKLGHYTFECKSSAQERPYISRPSRTQQVLNPRLQTKLAEVAPPEEPSLLSKNGIADIILKQKEDERAKERGRKRRRSGTTSPPAASRVKARSVSVSSYSSYSSIPSGRSQSPPARSNQRHAGSHDHTQLRRRSRSYSYSPDHERTVRRKYRDSPSPDHRGRRLSPTDFSRRTRSRSRSRSHRRRRSRASRMRSPPRSEVGFINGNQIPPRRPSPPRQRSMSPFTRRRLMTEQMQQGG